MKLWKSLKISIGSRSDPKNYSQDLPQWGGQGYELDGPSVRRVAFRARLKEPIDHHRRGPKGLMFSRSCGVSAIRYRDLGTEQEKEQGVFKSQTSLSTDSGLCTERGLRRTHIELTKPPGKRIGLKLADQECYLT
ncbi:unnamed protein product [Spodoptera exigua]|nr:unnamed protein product [Spodoptera exigua]